MAQAYEYGSKELIRDLRRSGPRLARWYFGQRGKRWALIKESVSGCTFRAFPGLDVGPSKIFRFWARGFLTVRLDDLSEIQNQDGFNTFLEEAYKGLSTVWLNQGGQRLKYGPGMKLLNLLLKATLRLPRFTADERERLMPLLHVPLDKFSLAAVRRFSHSGDFGPAVWIPRGTGMGYVTTRELYDDLQQIMRGVAAAAGVPPIYIDLLAWNMAHA